MSAPAWSAGTPTAPIGWSTAQNADGTSIDVIATPLGGSQTVVLTINHADGTEKRAVLTAAQATALGVTLDSSGHISITV